MKNLAKDYLYGLADGIGEMSIKMPYFFYSSIKNKERILKSSDYFLTGFNHGAVLGTISTFIQLAICLNLASNGHLEYLSIPAGTNILSIIYEKFKN